MGKAHKPGPGLIILVCGFYDHFSLKSTFTHFLGELADRSVSFSRCDVFIFKSKVIGDMDVPDDVIFIQVVNLFSHPVLKSLLITFEILSPDICMPDIKRGTDMVLCYLYCLLWRNIAIIIRIGNAIN